LTPMICWDLEETHAMYLKIFQVIVIFLVSLKLVYLYDVDV
jgi:hypothetical protein